MNPFDHQLTSDSAFLPVDHDRLDGADSVHGQRPQTDLERILAAPRVPLGQWPTPVEPVTCRARTVLVKRDDLSGFGRGGAKTRKIEHVLGLMQARGCDELLTAIGNITNLGFDLLPALGSQRLSWRIFVQDDPPLPATLRSDT